MQANWGDLLNSRGIEISFLGTVTYDMGQTARQTALRKGPYYVKTLIHRSLPFVVAIFLQKNHLNSISLAIFKI